MKDRVLISLILIICFTQGIFELTGGLGLKYTRLIVEILLLILFAKIIFNKRKNVYFGIFCWFSFIIVSIISGLYNEKTSIEIFVFLRRFALYFIFFWAVYNSNMNFSDYRKIFKLVVVLLIVQIPATIVKFLILGTTEQVVIGTMDPSAGSLPAILPMAVVGFTFSLFLSRKLSLKWFLLILVFSIFFGIVGSKRASIFYIALISMIVYIFYNITNGSLISLLKYLPLVLLISLGTLFLGIKIIPSLNPDNKIMGRFDLEYVVDYMNDYSSRSTDGAIGSGRREAWPAAIYFLSSRQSILLGTGAGDLTYSSLSGNIKKGENFKYNLGYGTGITMIQVILQVGVLGLLCYLLMYISIFNRLINKYRTSTNYHVKAFLLASLAVFFTHLWDSFAYSQTSMVTLAFFFPSIFVVIYSLKMNEFYKDLKIN